MKTRRAGLLTLEMLVALGLVGVTLVAAAQLSLVIQRQRQRADQVRLATREAGNLLEQSLRLSWAETTSDKLAELEIPTETASLLGDPQVTLSVIPGEDSALKRVDVTIVWEAARSLPPVHLMAWKHRPAGPAEENP